MPCQTPARPWTNGGDLCNRREQKQTAIKALFAIPHMTKPRNQPINKCTTNSSPSQEAQRLPAMLTKQPDLLTSKPLSIASQPSTNLAPTPDALQELGVNQTGNQTTNDTNHLPSNQQPSTFPSNQAHANLLNQQSTQTPDRLFSDQPANLLTADNATANRSQPTPPSNQERQAARTTTQHLTRPGSTNSSSWSKRPTSAMRSWKRASTVKRASLSWQATA
jgi:hypothetical protein